MRKAKYRPSCSKSTKEMFFQISAVSQPLFRYSASTAMHRTWKSTGAKRLRSFLSDNVGARRSYDERVQETKRSSQLKQKSDVITIKTCVMSTISYEMLRRWEILWICPSKIKRAGYKARIVSHWSSYLHVKDSRWLFSKQKNTVKKQP